jgi:hypothetical protein
VRTAAATTRAAAHDGSQLDAVLRLLLVTGLLVDAYVHVDLADVYDAIGQPVTQGALFRLAAGLALLSAMLVITLPRPATYVLALLAAGAALGAVLAYRYVDVGSLGFLPDMYEPLWYTSKSVSAVAEALAVATAVALLRPSPRPRPLPGQRFT